VATHGSKELQLQYIVSVENREVPAPYRVGPDTDLIKNQSRIGTEAYCLPVQIDLNLPETFHETKVGRMEKENDLNGFQGPIDGLY
jgi:hypothetical protein